MSHPIPPIPTDLPTHEDRLFRALQAYTLFIQGLFKTRPRGQWQWSPNDETTEVIITGRAPLEIDKEEHRPAIVVVRKAAQYLKLSQTGRDKEFLSTGARENVDMMGSAMVIHCLGRTGEVASALGWYVFRHIPIFHGIIQKWGAIHAVALNVQIGEESDPGAIVQGASWPDVIDVPVTSPFHIQDTVRVTPHADKDFQSVLRDITMTMETGLGFPGPNIPTRTGGPVGSAVDTSQELPGGDLGLRPPTWKGKPLRVVRKLGPGRPDQPTRPLQVEVSIGPEGE